MKRLLSCSIMALALAVSGCGSGQEEELQGNLDTPNWPALEAVTGTPLWQPIKMNADFKNWQGVKDAVANPEFIKAFEAFKKEPIPGKFSTAPREEARKDYIKNIEALIEGANQRADTDLDAAVTGAANALQKIQEVPAAPEKKK